MRHWLPRFLIIASLGLHVLTAASYIRQPDMMAAVTVYPIWMWGFLGLLPAALAFVFWRARLSLILVILWSITIITASDETYALSRMGHNAPEPGPSKPFQSQETLRICTLNWGATDYAKDEVKKQTKIILSYQPDIVFLQEIHPWQARMITDVLYSGGGDYRTGISSAILTRWKIDHTTPNTLQHSQHVTLKLPPSFKYPNGRFIDCINFHLHSANTDMRLWRRSCWKSHSNNRKLQRHEVSSSLNVLQNTTTFPTRPAIVAGDFNSPASDPLHDLLRVQFNDSFSEAGTGWANTWHRRIPLHRIDYIYTNPLLKAVRSKTVIVPASDHRMLVSDFILLP